MDWTTVAAIGSAAAAIASAVYARRANTKSDRANKLADDANDIAARALQLEEERERQARRPRIVVGWNLAKIFAGP